MKKEMTLTASDMGRRAHENRRKDPKVYEAWKAARKKDGKKIIKLMKRDALGHFIGKK